VAEREDGIWGDREARTNALRKTAIKSELFQIYLIYNKFLKYSFFSLKHLDKKKTK